MPRKSKISDIKPKVTSITKPPVRKAAVAGAKTSVKRKVNGTSRGLNLVQRKELRAELAIKRREAAAVKKSISEHKRATQSLTSSRNKELKLLDRDWNARTKEINKLAKKLSG